jgi:hypothetical protein
VPLPARKNITPLIMQIFMWWFFARKLRMKRA